LATGEQAQLANRPTKINGLTAEKVNASIDVEMNMYVSIIYQKNKRLN